MATLELCSLHRAEVGCGRVSYDYSGGAALYGAGEFRQVVAVSHHAAELSLSFEHAAAVERNAM